MALPLVERRGIYLRGDTLPSKLRSPFLTRWVEEIESWR
jgi:hypothetical protein